MSTQTQAPSGWRQRRTPLVWLCTCPACGEHAPENSTQLDAMSWAAAHYCQENRA